MTKRIFLSTLISIAFTLLLSFIFIFCVLYGYFSDLGVEQLRTTMRYVKEGFLSDGIAYVERTGAAAGRITLIQQDGTVLFDNAADAAQMENHSTRPEVTAALSTGSGSDARTSDTLLETTLYYAERLGDGTVLRIASTRHSPITLVLGMLQPLIVILVVVGLFSAYLSLRVARGIVKPINALDLEHPEQNAYEEELSPLLRKISAQKQEIDEKIALIQQNQKEFETITQNMREGFLLVNRKTEILSFNESARQLLGDMKNKTLLAVNRSNPFRELSMAVETGQRADKVLQMENKHYQILCNPVKADDGIEGAVLLIVDITEKQERETLRREFSANVSHELKTPLTSISGYAEIVMNGLVEPEDVSVFAGKIYDEAQRLIRLIQDILNLSALEEGTHLPEKEPVDLYALAQQSKERFAEKAGEKGVGLQVSGKPVLLSGYRQILLEMLDNLCDNAIKYNRPGGRVQISVWKKGEKTGVSVTDNGIGIPQAEQDRVFERFYRVDKAHSSEIAGTGLGLSIVKHGAALHDAEISLNSHEGRGTAIQIVFPQ